MTRRPCGHSPPPDIWFFQMLNKNVCLSICLRKCEIRCGAKGWDESQWWFSFCGVENGLLFRMIYDTEHLKLFSDCGRTVFFLRMSSSSNQIHKVQSSSNQIHKLKQILVASVSFTNMFLKGDRSIFSIGIQHQFGKKLHNSMFQRYVGENLKCESALIDSVCVLVCKNFFTLKATKLSGMKIQTITFPGNISFWFRDNRVASDTMLFTITRYVGEDLKCDCGLIDTFSVFICKKILYTERKTKLAIMKI